MRSVGEQKRGDNGQERMEERGKKGENLGWEGGRRKGGGNVGKTGNSL